MTSARPRATAARLARLARLTGAPPTLAIVLGSGFYSVLEELQTDRVVPFAKLPGFPRLTVPGHAGACHWGRLAGVPVLVLAGRAHYYEGHDLPAVTFAVRTLAALGITDLLLTNAAGGIHPRLQPGAFMVVSDHINFMGVNPLRGALRGALQGALEPGRTRFVDLTATYDRQWQGLLRQAGRRCAARTRPGVYLAVSGPSYETPAEIRAFARWGADAVGMSTVPEAIVARQCGLRVAALSCITNRAAGRGGAALSHAEVLAAADRVKATAAALLREFTGLYAAARRD